MKKKFLRVNMSNGTKWDVPLFAIITNKAKEHNCTTEEIVEQFEEDDYSIKDWASNNMNWDDVEDIAIFVTDGGKGADYQEDWVNGEHEIISA